MNTIILIILLIVLIIFLFAYIVYKMAFYNKNILDNANYDLLNNKLYLKHKNELDELIKEAKENKYEDVYIKSFDNVTLHARYLHVNDNKEVQILFHGYKGNSYIDMCGGLKLALQYGSNVLLVDQRSHGLSKSHTITFGIKERKDVLSWINYVNKRFNYQLPIIISGISMGASSVLMAANLNLAQNVVGIMADCPFLSARDILIKVLKQYKLPVFIFYPLLIIAAFVYGHFNLNKTNCLKAVQESTIPILLIHGKDDELVPCSMSEKLVKYRYLKSTITYFKYNGSTYYLKNKNIELHLFNNAGHGMSYLTDNVRYQQITINFLNKVLIKYQEKHLTSK